MAEVWRGAGARRCAGTYPGSVVLPPESPLPWPSRAEQLPLSGSRLTRTMSDGCLGAGEVCLEKGSCAVPWVHGAGVELRTESGQPRGAFRVSVCWFRATYMLRASP